MCDGQLWRDTTAHSSLQERENVNGRELESLLQIKLLATLAWTVDVLEAAICHQLQLQRRFLLSPALCGTKLTRKSTAIAIAIKFGCSLDRGSENWAKGGKDGNTRNDFSLTFKDIWSHKFSMQE